MPSNDASDVQPNQQQNQNQQANVNQPSQNNIGQAQDPSVPPQQNNANDQSSVSQPSAPQPSVVP